MMVLPSRAGDLLSQDLLRPIPVTFLTTAPWPKEAGDRERSPASGREQKVKKTQEKSRYPSDYQSMPQMRTPFPHKRTISMIFFSIFNLCLC